MSKTDQPATKAAPAKPKIIKRKPKKTPADKPKSADIAAATAKPAATKATTDKPKVVKRAPKTSSEPAPAIVVPKIDAKSVLLKTTDIKIQPAKVKKIVSNCVLNKDACSALKEIKDAMPRKAEGDKPAFGGKPVAQLSAETLACIKLADSCFEKCSRDDYARVRVSKMAKDVQKAYTTARNAAKSAHEEKHPAAFMAEPTPFDLEAFNIKYDAKFYAEYDAEKKKRDAADKTDEWKRACNLVSKLKTRFSANARDYLAALAEYLVRQMALNGIAACKASGKKTVKIEHAIDNTNPNFADCFKFYPFIVNLSTFKQAQNFIRAQAAPKPKPVKPTEGEESDEEKKVERKELSIDLPGISPDTQYQLKYYIQTTYKEINAVLNSNACAGDKSSETKADSKKAAPKKVYDINVSTEFKNFCSSVVCEFLVRIGNMLKNEISTRGIKTVNDTIIGAVISQYHIVCGVEPSSTVEFIHDIISKHATQTKEKQAARKKAKGGDLKYTDA